MKYLISHLSITLLNVQKYKKSQRLVCLKLGGQTVAHFLLNVRGEKNQQLFAKRCQFPDQLVVLDAVDGEERAPVKLWVLLTQFLFLLSFMMPLGLVQGFCGDIIFGIVADPEEDALQWIAFDERHPDDVLETFVEIAIVFLIMTCGQRDELVQAVEGEAEYFAREGYV